MRKLLRDFAAVVLFAAMLVCPGASLGQGPDQESPLAEPGVPSGPTLEEARASLKAVEDNGELDEVAKASLADRYGEAIRLLKAAEAARNAAASYRTAIDRSPEETKQLEAELQQLEGAVGGAPLTAAERAMEPSELRYGLDRAKTDLEREKANLQMLESRVLKQRNRPNAIPVELTEAQAAVRDAEEEMKGLLKTREAGPLMRAENVVLGARQAAGLAEINKLEQEQASVVARLRVLTARRELGRMKIKILEGRVEALQQLVDLQRAKQIRGASELAEEARKIVLDHPGLSGLATEIADYARQLQEVAGEIRATRERMTIARTQLESSQAEHRLVIGELEYGGQRMVLSQGLLSQRQNAAAIRDIERRIARRSTLFSKVRLAALRIDTEIRKSESARVDDDSPDAESRSRMMESRRALLGSLEDDYRRLIRDLGALDLVERRFLAESEENRKLLKGKLLWLPSTPPVELRTFTDFPSGLRWMFGSGRFGELLGGLRRVIASAPLLIPGVLLVIVLMWVFRHRLRRHVEGYSTKIRRVSTDRYSYTAVVLFIVLLRSLPTALLVLLIGNELMLVDDPSDWLEGVGLALISVSPILFLCLFVREMTRKGGMAEGHFGWSRSSVRCLRRAMTGFSLGYIPLRFVLVAALADSTGQHLHSFVRLALIFAQLWAVFWYWYLLRPGKGVLTGQMERNPRGYLARLSHLWFPAAVMAPLVLVGMVIQGYLFGAFEMMLRFELTEGIIFGAVIIYELLLRWFTIRERKMALIQLLEERRARRAAMASDSEPGEPGEEDIPEVEEKKIDLIAIGAQMRQLLRFAVSSLAVVCLWFGWGDVHPFMTTLDSTTLFWGLTFADLLIATLMGAVTVAVARNLPGILEVAILSKLPIDSGTRYAVTTLSQYLVTVIGIVAVFSAVHLEWSRFGWIAAALSVGLGFGLQEVVANLVCGILLLFERPMRIGDVVTVGDVSGVVSSIRMRATTIIDWDRKEYVVPNKEFVTGRLLNWTLSSRINRITIMVGVAYGSDTDRVREILAGCAAKNPDILDEPSPIVTFRNFGDSSLDFEVRCYLPDTDRRLQVYHDMHSEIHRRFAAEGIQIPFPQRDLHMRGGWGGRDPAPGGGN